MATISVSLPSDGTTADVSDYNTPITTIVNDYNGNIDDSNIAAAAAISGSKIADSGITPAKLSAIDWFKHIPAYAVSTSVAGSWTQIGTSGTGGTAGLIAEQSGGTQNEEVQYKAVLAAGTYKVYIYHDKDVNRGIYTVSVDASSIGTVDAYAGTRVAGVLSSITTSLVISTGKLVSINVKMATKNASSSGYYANFFELLFVRTA